MILISPISTLLRQQGENWILGIDQNQKDCSYQMLKVGSFGLKNALAKFQRAMDQVFTSLDYAKFYTDDIILFGSIME